MTIAPIVQSAFVEVPPPRAFTLFAGMMGDWWGQGKTVGRQPHVAIVIEPVPGGRWYERDADGNETMWGNVIAWEPPHRLLLAWRLGPDFVYDPSLETELELNFMPEGEGTRVTLEHRHLERFGALARETSEKLRNGWPGVFARFTGFAGQREKAQ
jgi:uncharacterized protein YndB with AHSA1/START domain